MTAPTASSDAVVERRFALLGSAVSVRIGGPLAATAAVRLDRLLAPFAAPVARTADDPTVFTVEAEADGSASLAGDGPAVVGGTWPQIEARLLVALNALAIAGYDGLAVHAGVVAADGGVVCFPGTSGAGKSTITAACLLRGFTYVSDEALCIDRSTGSVAPYPRPLALSRRSLALVGCPPSMGESDGDADGGSDADADDDRETTITAADLGAPVASPDAALGLTDIVELQRGATELHLEPVHRARAVPALLSMSFNHFKEPDTSVEVVGGLARDVRVWRLHYDDPLAAADLLRATLGEPASSSAR